MSLDSISCLIYDWTKVSPQPTNPIDNGVVIQIPMQWYATFPEVFCEFFLHELCHYLFSATGLPDTTHDYTPTFSQKSRTDYYLYLIMSLEKPFNTLLGTSISPVAEIKPDVVITRTSDDGIQTIGQLVVGDGKFGCFTLERPWLNNQKNISCIPKGFYPLVKWVHTLRFPFGVYQIQNVPNRNGIDLHSLSFWWDTQGCIGLGGILKDLNFDGKKDSANSQLLVNAFNNFMGHKDFSLQIK